LELQELIKIEQEAPVCTWMIDQLMKKLEIKISEFLDLLQEFDSNLFESWLWFT
jgi:hypothetical protein